MTYTLYIQTDDDFSIKFKHKLYIGYAFELKINNLSELDEIEILGPHGDPKTDDTKCWELEDALKRIKANPNEEIDTTGGNRGVCWYNPNPPITSLTTYFTVLPKDCNHHIPMIFGGEFMGQMDIAAAMLVAKLLTNSKTATHAVTHKFEGEFMAAAEMGDIIELSCSVTEVRKRAIVIRVKAYRQRRGIVDSEYIAWAKFVFVSKNDSGFVEHGIVL